MCTRPYRTTCFRGEGPKSPLHLDGFRVPLNELLFSFSDLIIGFQALQYTALESENLTVCLHVIGGILAPDFMVSANLSTSPGGGIGSGRPCVKLLTQISHE